VLLQLLHFSKESTNKSNAYLMVYSLSTLPLLLSLIKTNATKQPTKYPKTKTKQIMPLGNYSCLRVDLIFTRDRAFYFTTVFIPGIILVTSSFITFWLEWNAVPARSMIGNNTKIPTNQLKNNHNQFLPSLSLTLNKTKKKKLLIKIRTFKNLTEPKINFVRH